MPKGSKLAPGKGFCCRWTCCCGSGGDVGNGTGSTAGDRPAPWTALMLLWLLWSYLPGNGRWEDTNSWTDLLGAFDLILLKTQKDHFASNDPLLHCTAEKKPIFSH